MNTDTPPALEPAVDDASAEQLFLTNLQTIDRICAHVSRQHRLSADDAEEFTPVVHLKLVPGHYATLRKFQGRCALRTFLTVVIQRIFLDHRAATWGKWRPSARSRREGPVAVLLERLTMRSGLSFDDACRVIETNYRMPVRREECERLFVGYRHRHRPQFTQSDDLSELAICDGSADRDLTRQAGREAPGAGLCGA